MGDKLVAGHATEKIDIITARTVVIAILLEGGWYSLVHSDLSDQTHTYAHMHTLEPEAIIHLYPLVE